MTVATTQANGYFRVIPLNNSEEYQNCRELSANEVPTLSGSAVVGNVTPRSIRYDDGQQSWYVEPSDKTVIRAYRERRSDSEIAAGAFPVFAVFFDGKGPL